MPGQDANHVKASDQENRIDQPSEAIAGEPINVRRGFSQLMTKRLLSVYFEYFDQADSGSSAQAA
jgi:hypothetical protein